jgi:phosphate transport system substrate-binding protein
MIDSYSKVRPDVHAKAMVPPLGSNGGLRALAAGVIDIAVATIPSSFPTASENEATNKIIPWVRTPFIFTGRDIVSGTKLTLGQVADLYSGRVAQWPDGKPVRLVTRTERESDTRLLRAISREMNETMTKASNHTGMPFAENDIDNQQLLERVPGSFGAIGLGQALLSDSSLKPISLDGVLPTVENLKSGAYRMEKPLYLIVSKSPSAATLEFIQYLHSPDVLKAIGRYGFIPMPR